MASVNESLNNTQLNSELKAGLDVLSLNQAITFTQYNRVVLPLDGYVFWVKNELLSPNYALFNSTPYNKAYFNETTTVKTAAPQITVKGSLHLAAETAQEVDEVIGKNTVIFSAQQEIEDFNVISPNTMYIADVPAPSGVNLKVAFNRRESFYFQAGIYHYRGNAVFPAMFSQIIDDPRQFNSKQIISNSLPVWLSLNQIMPVYPAFLSPFNLRPSYATVEIADTRALQAAPLISQTGTHEQLVKDIARITIYGVRNDQALDYQDYVFDYSVNSDTIGIMNMPVIVDVPRKQEEIQVLAIKKTIEFEVNYYQSRVQNVAKQFILSAVPSFSFQ